MYFTAAINPISEYPARVGSTVPPYPCSTTKARQLADTYHCTGRAFQWAEDNGSKG